MHLHCVRSHWHLKHYWYPYYALAKGAVQRQQGAVDFVVLVPEGSIRVKRYYQGDNQIETIHTEN